MRVITQNEFGGPEVLHEAEAPEPSLLPTEILVRVRATGVNPVDAMIREGRFPLIGEPPFVLGWDVSGVVERVAPGVNRFAPGDEVYGMPRFPREAGAYAEYVAAPSRHFARKPELLDHAHTAALPVAGLTAWQGLEPVEPGDRVLVHGAGGGVGHVAVQLAKARGAYVIATASAAKHAFLRELGADELIDYRDTDFAEAVSGVDLVFDGIGHGTRSLRVLRPGGTLATIVEHGDAALAAETVAAGFRFHPVAVEPDHAALEALTALVDAGKLVTHVEHAFPLADAAKAHELVQAGRTQGKVVLIP